MSVTTAHRRIAVPTSRLGLGTYHLTSDRGVPHAEALDVVRAACDAGITVFDTAPMYGLGEAELILRRALGDRLSSGELLVVDKVGRFESSILKRLGDTCYTDPAAVLRQLEHSLRVLELDKLPLLLLHETDWAEWWPDGSRDDAPVVEFVREAKRRGLVEHVGISARKRPESVDLIRTGLFDAILYVHYYNVVWQEAGDDVIAAADEAGLVVLIGAPYRQGLLLQHDRASLKALRAERRTSVPPGAVDRIELVQAVADEIGMSMPQLGLRWLLSDPRVDSVVVGPRSTAELATNLRWAGEGPLDPVVLDRLRAVRHIDLGTWA